MVYGKSAENCGKYLKKGALVLIEGKFRQRRWNDRETGAGRSKIEVVANPAGGVVFMPHGKSGEAKDGVPPNVSEAFPNAEPVSEGDIPF